MDNLNRDNLRLRDYDYALPKNLIAQEPAKPRDSSRLMAVDTSNNIIRHLHFRDIAGFFKKDDVLVLNNTKVLPNRLYGKKKSGAPASVVVEEKSGKDYICRVQANNPKIGSELIFQEGLSAVIKGRVKDRFFLRFNTNSLKSRLKKYGALPTPAYIKSHLSDERLYQTIFAKKAGSLAAPTAGLHFTERIIKKLKEKGVIIVYVSLHISFGTFTPIDENKHISAHIMDKELFEITKEAAQIINNRKGRLAVCGTTSFKALLSAADENGIIKPQKKKSDLFIYPGHNFRIRPDMMITNFHLPKSTLLLFVSAFFGKDMLFLAYDEAIKNNYRFYSLGDAMLLM